MNPGAPIRLGAVAPDPGGYVTSEELRDYADMVNKFIRDINISVVNNEDAMGETAKALWPQWVKFRLDWETVYSKTRTTWVRGAAYLAVRDYHQKAIDWKDRWEKAGMVLTTVEVAPVKDAPPGAPEQRAPGKPIDVPAPPPSASPSAETSGSAGGGGISAGWYVAGGCLLVGAGAVLAKRVL